MTDLAGKTALITGGGTGIGAAIARDLAGRGGRVVLASRNRDHLEQVAAELRAQGLDAAALVCDLNSPRLSDEVRDLAPRVDVLVNNAAVFAGYGKLERVPQAEIDQVLQVDLHAALQLTRLVLPGMKERRHGRILNIGSIAARLGAAGQVAYATAKAALVGMTRSVAVECVGTGVTCNLIEPGLIGTSGVKERVATAVLDRLVSATPVGRMGLPEEVAHAAAFLASPSSGLVTGATLPVSGGLELASGL